MSSKFKSTSNYSLNSGLSTKSLIAKDAQKSSPTKRRSFTSVAPVNRSFVTSGGSRSIRRGLNQSVFAYSLSKEEQSFHRDFNRPMKDVPPEEMSVLKAGERNSYLTLRYEHAPDDKYNYPEATSWRIGWFHNQRSAGGSSKLSEASKRCSKNPKFATGDYNSKKKF